MLFPKPVGNTLPLNLFFPTHSVLFPSALLWSEDGLFVLQNTLKCIVFHVIWITLRKWCYTPLQHDFALDPIIPPFDFHFRIYTRDFAILTEWWQQRITASTVYDKPVCYLIYNTNKLYNLSSYSCVWPSAHVDVIDKRKLVRPLVFLCR
jgi:hypothetical protein